MNYELPHLEDIERYAGGLMSGQEASAFRQRLAIDKALMAEFKAYQTLKAGIKTFHRDRLLKQMSHFETQFQQKATPFYQNITFRKLGIAASVAALLAVGIFIRNQNTNKQEKGWQAEYIEEPGLPVLMSKNNNAYNQAMNFYRQSQFQEALKSLPDNASDTTAFYRGIFWLKLQNTDSALLYLDPLRRNESSVFQQKADYYSAMALWKAGKDQEAKAAFEKMATNANHAFQDISTEILDNSF